MARTIKKASQPRWDSPPGTGDGFVMQGEASDQSPETEASDTPQAEPNEAPESPAPAEAPKQVGAPVITAADLNLNQQARRVHFAAIRLRDLSRRDPLIRELVAERDELKKTVASLVARLKAAGIE